MSAKRKHGTLKTRLNLEVHPDNQAWLYKRSRARRESMGITLDKILSAFHQVAANLTQDSASKRDS